MLLANVKQGEIVKLIKIIGGNSVYQRLTDMGLIPGEEIEIVKNNLKGPIIIKLKESRLMLGHGLAEKIEVI